ncbi:hypothetical protein BDY24DRAFT_416028 [Mrakia frigida]|uniref:uncharacterized protein n=1 Tax=Mrakia frigida TaxID=29902 RepID=UPI003FCC2366
MLLDDKEEMTCSPQDSIISASSIPCGSPPSYSDCLPLRPLALPPSTLLSSRLPLPSLLLHAPRSSHYSHCTTGPTPIYHTHVFDLSRSIPEALLPKLEDRPEAVKAAEENAGKRANGLFWSERGEVKVVAGVVSGTGVRRTDKTSPVKLIFGSEAERRGEGEVEVKILYRHPPTLPISISLTSTFGSLHLLLPRNFRGHLTHLFVDQHHHQPSSSSLASPSSPSPLNLSPEIQALYTPLSNTQGFIGSFEGEGGNDDASESLSLEGLDEAFLSTGGGTITVGFAEDDQDISEADTKELVHQTDPPPTQDERSLSSALDSLTTSSTTTSQPSPFPRFLSEIGYTTLLGPLLLAFLLLLFLSTIYLLQHGPVETLRDVVHRWNWNELGRTLGSAGLVLVAGVVGWAGWLIAVENMGLGWEVPEEVGFVLKRLGGGWWEEERGWGGVRL